MKTEEDPEQAQQALAESEPSRTRDDARALLEALRAEYLQLPQVARLQVQLFFYLRAKRVHDLASA